MNGGSLVDLIIAQGLPHLQYSPTKNQTCMNACMHVHVYNIIMYVCVRIYIEGNSERQLLEYNIIIGQIETTPT